MWYRIDFIKFVGQMLPPVLRGRTLLALLKVLAVPLCRLHERFMAYRDNISSRLDITAAVQYIEKRLNDEFYLKDRQIYIGTPEDRRVPPFYFLGEKQPENYFHMTGGAPFYLRRPDDVPASESFLVYVPSFLCTSLDPEQDRYKGEHLQAICNLLNYYKPAGRSYRIALYDYE